MTEQNAHAHAICRSQQRFAHAMLQRLSNLSVCARLLAPAFTLVLGLSVASPAHAALLELRPTADNTLYEDPLGNASNALGESLFAGKTQTELLRRSLLKFDLSALPAGATIDAVSLTLHCTRSVSLAEPVALHRTLASWGEGTSLALGAGGNGSQSTAGDATWLHRFYTTESWSTPGGDFALAPSTTTLVSGIGSYEWTGDALRTDVQAWLTNASQNFGWTLLGNEELIGSAKRFASRENIDEQLRPLLRVAYTIPAPATSVLACAALVLRRRSR
jgi:hypothetical protein